MLNSSSAEKAIQKRLAKRRLFYVCRDIERAVKADFAEKNYCVISNHNKFSAMMARRFPNITLIKDKELLDTRQLLLHTTTKKIVRKNDYVLVFKNSALIEAICAKNGWRLLNPDAKLAEKVESKISQIEWLGQLAKYLPQRQIDICGNLKWRGKPFILQFDHSHTGSGTIFVDCKEKLDGLKAKFFKRPARATKFIKGPVFTNNNAVCGNKFFFGNISYQITGLSPFTENRFATIGNDWALPSELLSGKQVKQYRQMAANVGKKLKKDGWRGLFGIDAIMDEKTRRLYLLEINARQPASASFESRLQKIEIKNRKSEITIFEAHLLSLLSIEPKKYKLIKIFKGAQVVQRVTEKISALKPLKIGDRLAPTIIPYPNKKIGTDLVRIQCGQALMKKHNVFNKLGEEIIAAVLNRKK